MTRCKGLFCIILLFVFIVLQSCVHNAASKESVFEISDTNLEKPLLIEKKTNITFPNAVTSSVDGIICSSVKLNELNIGFHRVRIEEDNKSQLLFFNKINDDVCLLIPNSIVWKGRYFKKINFNNTFRQNMQDSYSVSGSYFNSEKHPRYSDCFDDDGIPYSSDRGYNPVTIAQYALSFWGTNNSADVVSFLNVADFLCAHLEPSGGFPYTFDFTMHEIELKAPWYSCMAQGQLLSVLSRAYLYTSDIKYLNAGYKVYDFIKPEEFDDDYGYIHKEMINDE
ncbi:MAG: hypothetical protein HUJ68_13715, partial [Clostridia bacterium]|nr:hypothetical protein [Clostridia bacterium]